MIKSFAIFNAVFQYYYNFVRMLSGNDWVFGGIPLILNNLPADDPEHPYFETQDKDGHWHASLLDPDSYPDAMRIPALRF